MIKVLMCGDHPSNKGGMISVVNQILEYDWNKENITIEFIPTYKSGKTTTKIIFFVQAYLKIIKKMMCNKPDLVHLHMSYKGSFLRTNYIHLLCKIFRVKDVIHLHGSEFEKWYKASNKLKKERIRNLLKECSGFIVLGEKWKKIIYQIEPLSNLYIVNNGVKIPNKMVRWNEKTCEVLYLGALIPRKGIIDLISAVNILKNKGSVGNMHFTIAGTGEEETKIKAEVIKRKLNKEIKIVGWISGEQKNAYLEKCQLMILPSYNEGMPISILEAASYGMPIISTDVGDIPSVVINEKNGFLFNPGDVDKMIEGLLFASKEENFKRMSLTSREIAETNFSIDIFYDKLTVIYKNLCGL